MGFSACHKVRGPDISDKAILEEGGLHNRTLSLESGNRERAPHFNTAFVYYGNDVHRK